MRCAWAYNLQNRVENTMEKSPYYQIKQASKGNCITLHAKPLKLLPCRAYNELERPKAENSYTKQFFASFKSDVVF